MMRFAASPLLRIHPIYSPTGLCHNDRSMEIVQVTPANLQIYLNLIQGYEGEFAVITGKKPNCHGLFELDTVLDTDVVGYLLYIDGLPAGLAALKTTREDCHEICEFYISPGYRKKSYGRRFAHALWELHRGRWEVKQIEGAEYATLFWRKVIAMYCESFTQDIYDDPYWGKVTRQCFVAA